MSKYKLVPIEPTQEMIHAGQMAVSGFPRDVLERWQAMLTAAPAVEQAPAAWVSPNALSRLNPDSPVNCALVHKRRINETLPLYLHPQPTPEVAKLVGVLEGILSIVYESDGASGYHLNGDIAKWCEFEDVAMAEEALSLYRQQGGDL